MQLPVNEPGSAAKDSSSMWVLNTQVRDQDRVPDPWPMGWFRSIYCDHLGSEPWEWSISLSLLFFQINKYILKNET